MLVESRDGRQLFKGQGIYSVFPARVLSSPQEQAPKNSGLYCEIMTSWWQDGSDSFKHPLAS